MEPLNGRRGDSPCVSSSRGAVCDSHNQQEHLHDHVHASQDEVLRQHLPTPRGAGSDVNQASLSFSGGNLTLPIEPITQDPPAEQHTMKSESRDLPSSRALEQEPEHLRGVWYTHTEVAAEIVVMSSSKKSSSSSGRSGSCKKRPWNRSASRSGSRPSRRGMAALNKSAGTSESQNNSVPPTSGSGS